MRTMNLDTELFATGRQEVEAGRVTDLQLAEAYRVYAEYFRALQDWPGLEPPTSQDPAIDELLLAIWDTLVDREQRQLDGHLVGPTKNHGTLEELYQGTFEELIDKVQTLIDDPEAESRALAETVATLAAIGEELGLTITTEVEMPDLPQEAQAVIMEDADDHEATLRQLAKIRQAHPRNLALNALYTVMLPSPEETLKQTMHWGSPIDPRQVGEITDDELGLGTYLFFEEACLTVYAARGERYGLLKSMQRLLKLTGLDETADQRIEYFLSQGIQAQVGKGNLMPDSWPPPQTEAAFPEASHYLLEAWAGFQQSLADEFYNMFSGSGLTAGDFTVPQGYYQIKVTLDGIRPPIWRRLVVPANIELAELHRVIQVAMGWYDAHLHQFKTAMDYYAPPGSEDYAESYEGLTLNILMQQAGQKIRYEYDFGDSWDHEILLEKVVESAEAGAGTPRGSTERTDGSPVQCLKGKRACPPEDCGGVGGYYHLLEAREHPDQDDNAELLEWVGDFDPEAFDIAAVNAQLRALSRPASR